jgi:hypothetical protein
MFVFDKFLSVKEYSNFTSGNEDDGNVITIDKNRKIVSYGYRAPNDELNNSLLETYKLHLSKQKFELLIDKKLKRNVVLKIFITFEVKIFFFRI